MTDLPLLDIQHLDTEAEQLHHRFASLPARTMREEAVAEQARLAAEIDVVAAARVEVATRQKRHEDEAQIFATKADEDDARLYSGEVGMKDLQPLQHEIKGLRARQAELEDLALDAMEEAESLSSKSDELAAASAEVTERITTIDAEIVDAEAQINAELEDVAARRAEAAAAVSAEDLAQYERLRPGFGSATVVKFDGRNCVGCPSTMPAVELDRVKHAPPGSVLNCSECGRIVLN